MAPTHLLPAPSDGVVAMFAWYDGNVVDSAWGAQRIDESGEVLWTTTGLLSDFTGVYGAQVSEFGETVLTRRDYEGNFFMTLCLDAAGAIRWSIGSPLPGSVPWLPGRYAGQVVGFDTAGHPIVAGYVPDVGRYRASAMDRWTGAELWVVDVAAAAIAVASEKHEEALVDGGELHAVYFDLGFSGVKWLHVDSSGTTLAERALPIAPTPASLGYTQVAGLARRHDGQLLVAFAEPLTSGSGPGVLLVACDAAGSVLWVRDFPSEVSPVKVHWAPNGDALLQTASPGGKVHRLDGAGATVWEASGQISGGFRSSALLKSGDLLATATDAGRSLTVQIDPSGATRSVLAVDPPAGWEARDPLLSPVDSRGNAWVARQLLPLTAPFHGRGEAVSIIRDELQEAPVCVQAIQNSTGLTGRLHALGSPDVTDRNVTLLATGLPPGELTLFVTSRASGLTPNPGGSAGDLCLGSPLARFSARAARPDGTLSLALDLGLMPSGSGTVPVLAGETWYFQAWHRDGSGSNLTDGIAAAFP